MNLCIPTLQMTDEASHQQNAQDEADNSCPPPATLMSQQPPADMPGQEEKQARPDQRGTDCRQGEGNERCAEEAAGRIERQAAARNEAGNGDDTYDVAGEPAFGLFLTGKSEKTAEERPAAPCQTEAIESHVSHGNPGIKADQGHGNGNLIPFGSNGRQNGCNIFKDKGTKNDGGGFQPYRLGRHDSGDTDHRKTVLAMVGGVVPRNGFVRNWWDDRNVPALMEVEEA